MRIPDIGGVLSVLWKMTKTPHQSTSEGLPYDVKDKMWVGEVKYIGYSPLEKLSGSRERSQPKIKDASRPP